MKIATTDDGEPIGLNDDGTWQSMRQSEPVLEKWQSLRPSEEVVELFSGLFNTVRVRVIDTQETITCRHLGHRMEIAPGSDDDAPDFSIEIYGYQAARLAESVQKGTIDPLEQFRIARSLVAAQQTGPTSVARNPLISNSRLRKMISGKSLVHVYLTSPSTDLEPDARFSWINVDGEWLVVPGFHGQAQRTFRLSVSDALELVRQLFKAMSAEGVTDWVKLAQWYIGWRNKVEVPIAE